jgi:hypothetical protein
VSGYSYTTISLAPRRTPRVGVSIYPDKSAEVEYYRATGDAQAFIRIEQGDMHVHIGTTKDTKVTDEHVQFSRQLVDAATGFLADCERLHTEQAATDAA